MNHNDFDRFQKDDKSSSFISSSNNNHDEEEEFIKSDENQIVNMPKLVNLESYLDENKSVDVVVSAVANPCIFWVQIASSNGVNKELKEFTKSMNSFHRNNNEKGICYVKEKNCFFFVGITNHLE